MQREKAKTLQLIKCETPLIVRQIFAPNTNTSIYNAIRSGDITFFENTSPDLQEIESAYEELKIRNVSLTFEMQIYVEKLLLDQRLFTNKTKDKQLIDLQERIELIQTCFEDLSGQKHYNEVFHFVAKFIVKNLRILKKNLKRRQFYSKLPWEEMEFCMIAFIRAVHGLEEQDFLVRMVLNKSKIMKYLGRFLSCMSYGSNLANFEDLCNDYRLIKDIYSLNRILCYINHAVSAKLDETGKLIIERALQVMGEYLKNTSDSPHLSESIGRRLLENAPKQLKEIMTSLRNSLSHAYSLSEKIRLEYKERLELFEGIQNDLKKVGNEITIVILDLKYDICKEFLNKFSKVETREDFKIICEETAPFWYKQINQMKYQTEEWKRNVAITENLKHEAQNIFKDIVDFVNLKIADTEYKDKIYSNMLMSIIYLSETGEKCFDFVKSFVVNLSNAISSEKSTVSTRDQTCVIADHLNGLSKTGVKQTEQIFTNVVFSENKIKHMDRLNDKLSEREHEQEIDFIFHGIQSCMATEKEIKAFQKGINQKKLFHQTKMEILKKLDNCDVTEVLALIQKLNIKGKLGTYLENALQENRKDDLKQQIKRIDDSYELFMKNMVEANFFMCDKFKRTLKLFFKKAVPLKEIVLNNFIRTTTEKIEEYLSNRLKALRKNIEIDEVALETIMLDITEVYNSVTVVYEGVGFLDGPTTFLIGKHLRNYLAHGDPLIDILEYNPKVSLHCHMAKFQENVKSLTFLENTLFGSDVSVSINELKERYAKGLAFATSQNELFEAIRNGNSELVKISLNNGADPRGITVDEKTVLHLCAASNNAEIFKMFLQETGEIGESIWQVAVVENSSNILNYIKSFTPALMRIALVNKRKEIVDLFIKAGFDVNTILDEDGNTALHFADETTARLLLENQANIDAKNKAQKTALHNFCERGSLELVKELVKYKADINAETHQKLTPLHLACMLGHQEIVEILLKNGAVPYNKGSDFQTPLYYACFGGFTECVQLLLDAKADTNLDETSPLEIAASTGRKEVVMLLLESGICLIGKHAMALPNAALAGFKEIVQILLEAGVDVNAKLETGHTALHTAAENGYVSIIKLLLEYHAKIDSVTNEGHTPLFSAAYSGSAAIVKLLLENGADPNMCLRIHSGNYKPIHLASLMGHTEVVNVLYEYTTDQDDLNISFYLAAQNSRKEIVQILLTNGADPGAFVKIKSGNNLSYTALMTPILENHYEMVKILLDSGTPANVIKAKDAKPLKTNALHISAELGRYEIVKLLVERDVTLMNVVDEQNRTPLLCAIIAGHKTIVQFLLKHGAELDTSCLKIAVLHDHADIVEVLLKHQSDLMEQDEKNKNTTLMYAIAKGFFDIAEVLIRHGARTEYSEEEKPCVPLHIACVSGNVEAVNFLLSKNVNIDIKDENKTTSLHYAVRKGHEQVVELLLEHGADFTARNNHDSVLHAAVSSGNIKIAKLILKKIRSNHDFQKYIDLKDTEGDTPLMWAAEKGLVDMTKLLLNNGAAVDLKNKIGMTALDWAIKNGHNEVAGVLTDIENDPYDAICGYS